MRRRIVREVPHAWGRGDEGSREAREAHRPPKAVDTVVTEQGAFLDGFDNGAQREAGTRGLCDALGESLSKPVKR